MNDDKEYKVLKVSKEPPREWDNPRGGKIYYIKTMLEGWDKPVSVGKKSPDALHEGDTIYGHVEIAPGMPEDKWKAGQNPNFAPRQQSFGGGNKPAYQPRDDDAIRAQWAIGQAVGLYGVLHSQVKDMDAFIEERAKVYYSMVDRVKGSNSDSLKATAPVKGPVTTSKYDDDFASLVSGLEAEGVPEDEIPGEWR